MAWISPGFNSRWVHQTEFTSTHIYACNIIRLCAILPAESKNTRRYEVAEKHIHPMYPNQVVFGERLKAGATVQPDDVYDSTSGKWEKAPCPGVVLQESCETYWVRPDA